MVHYQKPWLSLQEQLERLTQRGLEISDQAQGINALKSIGYYRLSGYLYPYLASEAYLDAQEGKTKVRVLNYYVEGTHLGHALELIDFDRQLRLMVLEAVERLEVGLRMQMGYVLGRRSPFAHEDPTCFDNSFTTASTDSREPCASKQVMWLSKVRSRRHASDEPFAGHFREKYEDHMPIWALTELLELGHLTVLYRGMLQKDALEVAGAFGVPDKKLMTSWIASLNYVRNVAAHHGRLFNRKLQNAPGRPKAGKIPDLDHLRSPNAPKQDFGTYNALAIMAYLLRESGLDPHWAHRMADLLRSFPTSSVTIAAMGVPQDWEDLNIWN